MKRVLIISNSTGGLVSFRKEVISAISKKYKVYIIAPDTGKAEVLRQLKCKLIIKDIDRHGTNPIKELSVLRLYIRLIKKIRPSVVLTYTIKPNVYGGLACQLIRIPYIANVTGLGTSIENGGIMQLLTTNLYKIGLRKANCVFFQNSNNRKLFIDSKIVKRHTRLIPGSGVNLNFHTFEEYPDETEGLRFLFVGRIMKDKGIEELLSAMKKLHNEYPNISLDIVGGYDEDYSSTLDKSVVDGYVRYHGRQEDVHSFYKNTHCVVLPSYHEGMANVLLEGASTGRPVIASNIPGCRETFDEGKTGFGCKVKSDDSLADAMRKFIELSYEEKASMGIAGREKVKKEFDRSIIVNAYLDEINKIVRK